jgi:predicted AlkP superfamily phosphohydrolase/phosphomutase
MPARVLVIGLDAAESTLIEKWADEGLLPNIARLGREGARLGLGNPMESLPGAIWPEICSGVSCGKDGLFYHPFQIHTGEVGWRPVEHDEIDATNNYWSVASESGRRVCVIDQVQSALNTKLNGLQLLEWGLHDRTFSERSHPAELLDEIHERYGLHPIRRCDGYSDNEHGRDSLLRDLIKASEQKRALALDLLARENWELYACTLSETHCVGHHFWSCLESGSDGNNVAYPEAHRNAIYTIYKQADETIGRLIEAAGPDVTTLVVASHGIGPSHAGYHLLPEILVRLGMGSNAGRGGLSRWFRKLQTRIQYGVPDSWIGMLRALAAMRPVKALQRGAGSMRFPFESPQTRAIAVPNNRVGAIRLNLKGREPFGSVAPGNEAQSLLEELRGELLDLKDPATGDPIIDRVSTADEVFGRDHHPDVPDLMVVFRTGHGAVEACYSERVGKIEVPYFTRRTHRTGDHTVESRLWAVGPGILPGQHLPNANVLDIAPTILNLLDVQLPENLDGSVIALAGDPPVASHTAST